MKCLSEGCGRTVKTQIISLKYKKTSPTHICLYFLTFLCDSLSCSKEEEKDTNVPGTSTRKRKVNVFKFFNLYF